MGTLLGVCLTFVWVLYIHYEIARKDEREVSKVWESSFTFIINDRGLGWDAGDYGSVFYPWNRNMSQSLDKPFLTISWDKGEWACPADALSEEAKVFIQQKLTEMKAEPEA